MIGFLFTKDHNGFPHKAHVIEQLEDKTKYLVSLGDSGREEIMTYNDIMNLGEDQLSHCDEEQAWTFEAILNHRKVNGKWKSRCFGLLAKRHGNL